jgi:ligand-binding sensor domain-containing protein
MISRKERGSQLYGNWGDMRPGENVLAVVLDGQGGGITMSGWVSSKCGKEWTGVDQGRTVCVLPDERMEATRERRTQQLSQAFTGQTSSQGKSRRRMVF